MAINKSILNKRNFGISAHIDSGKTTLTERILYYCNKIHAIHEVKGKDGVGATMDSMELERERGITISSAATNVEWKDHNIDIIDTPGHVDFTIEVERSLRVLDGAILVLCSVGGVQSQSITVDRQLKRYKVPRLAFINKCDRTGANPYRVKNQLRDVLGLNAILVQIPIGLEDKIQGVVDLVTMKAFYFDGASGDDIREEEIPAELRDEAIEKRHEMIDAVSLFSDELAESYLEEKETHEQIRAAIRIGTISLQLVPVFVGSAYKNKGIQLLLDGVINYLPNPTEVENIALDLENDEKPVVLESDPDKSSVSLAFKLEDGAYGQLSYVRIYQGTLRKGDEVTNSRTRRQFRIGRLIKMHANSTEDITVGTAGDIVALFGIDCASGDSFSGSGGVFSMSSMFVPKPVISLAISPTDRKSADSMSKALNRFCKEDPTFHAYIDPESNETIIKGMGELHLEIYIERMRREYKVDLITGAPQVAYRETISQAAEFDYTHKKQTGGSGQYGRVCGKMEINTESDYEFIDDITGGSIPREFVGACDKGFKACLDKGSIIGFPIVGIKLTINDGAFHAVDSSDIAFQQASIGGFRQAYAQAKPVILEPIMKLSVEGPVDYQGGIIATINQRRGVITATTEDNKFLRVDAEVPLAEMFGYSTILRSATQGKAEFSMEFSRYSKVPGNISDKLIKEYSEKKK